MKAVRKHLICLFSLVLALLLLAACGKAAPSPAPSAEPEPAQEAVVEPAPEAAEPVSEPELPASSATPESRAAALGLPAPPDVDITSWEFLVANYYNSIHEYIPEYGGIEGQGFEAKAVEYAQAFLDGARAAGYPMYAAVAYRNQEYLLTYYTQQVRELGSAAAAASEPNTLFHASGVNEHQTGLAMDITDNSAYSGTYFKFSNDGITDSPTYAWAVEHCAEYGFILRYPEGKEAYYGINCIPGHFRYVGVDAATYIMENDLCLEEFLLLYDENAVYLPPEVRN